MSDNREDTLLITGRNPVREALEKGEPIEKIWMQQGIDRKVAADIRARAKEAGVPIQVVPGRRLEHMVPGAVNHQGLAARRAPLAYADVDEMLSNAAPDRDAVKAKKPVFIVLDGIQDPHNLGAIIRSAVAVGASGVITPERGSAPLNEAAIKASAGTATRIPVARVGNLGQVLLQVKERGYWVAGAAAGEEGETVWSMDWDRPLVIVIGSESSGLRPSILDACDYRVSIPMRGPAESLNASVAAGILMFAAFRDRS